MKPEAIIELLKQSNIDLLEHHHPVLCTVEESKEYDAKMPGGDCKNILLNDKKRRRIFLLIMEAHKQLDFKQAGERMNAKGLKFVNEETLERFDAFYGAVSPFVVLEDPNLEIAVFMDAELLGFDRLNFPPNGNTMTIGIPTQDFLSFMKRHNHEVAIINI